jgi:Ca2+/H+ antiporter
MPQPQNTLSTVLRSTRIVWASLLFAQFLYIVVGQQFFQHVEPAQPDKFFTIAMAVAAVVTLAFAFFFRIKLVRRASQSLQTDPADTAAITNWRKGQLLTMVLAEPLSLYGFALLATGMPQTQTAFFYATGIAATLLFDPKNPANI